MENELECPICDADIPLDGDEKPGDIIFCSYCNMPLKMVKKKDKWALIDDIEEEE